MIPEPHVYKFPHGFWAYRLKGSWYWIPVPVGSTLPKAVLYYKKGRHYIHGFGEYEFSYRWKKVS